MTPSRVAIFARAMLAVVLLSQFPAFSEQTIQGDEQASRLLAKLLSGDTPDEQFSAAEKEYEALPPSVALPVLFPEVAKGIPGGYSYAAYNCYEPLHDRKDPGWGEFCIVNWLWCKQVACLQRRAEVSKVLLQLWQHPISYAGQMALLGGLCSNPDAESRIAVLFREATADIRLRTEAAGCLLSQDEPKYHSAVVEFAESAPITFVPPGFMPYPQQLRRILFDELARHRSAGIDPAVVRIGFSLLLDEAEQRQKANDSGAKVSYYGEFIHANALNTYLGSTFLPDQVQPLCSGRAGGEKCWHDTVVAALEWWSKHKKEFAK